MKGENRDAFYVADAKFRVDGKAIRISEGLPASAGRGDRERSATAPCRF